MIFSLAVRNLRKNFSRAFLLIFAVVVGAIVLTIFAGIWFGVNRVLLSNLDTTRLAVRPHSPGSIVNMIGTKPVEFTEKQIAEVKKIPNVKNVLPQNFLHRVTTLEMNLSIGPWSGLFDIDTMVIGETPELFADEIDISEFRKDRKPTPVIVSSHLLDLYNFLIAEQANMPIFKQEDFIGKKFDLYLDYSSMLKIGDKDEATVEECEIIAFSPKAQISGITIPYELVKEWDYNPVQPNLLYVDADSPLNLRKVENTLLEKNYRVEIPGELKAFEKMSWYLALILGTLALIIWLAIGFSLATTFIALGEERRYEIGILRTIGASPRQISRLFFIEAGIIGFLGGLFGLLLGHLFGNLLNHYLAIRLQHFSFMTSDIYQLNYLIIIGVVLFAVLVSLFAAIVPALRASRTEIFTLVHEK